MLRKSPPGGTADPERQIMRTVCKAQDESQSRTDNSFVASHLLHSCLFYAVLRWRVSARLGSKPYGHPRCVSPFTPAWIETCVFRTWAGNASDRLLLSVLAHSLNPSPRAKIILPGSDSRPWHPPLRLRLVRFSEYNPKSTSTHPGVSSFFRPSNFHSSRPTVAIPLHARISSPPSVRNRG